MSKNKTPNPWYIGVVSGMASYIDSAAIVSSGTALVIYQKTMGITALQIGILSGLLTLSIAAGAFGGGRLGDRIGRRNVFIITMAMIFIGTLALAFGLNFPFLVLIYLSLSRLSPKRRTIKTAAILSACPIYSGWWELAPRWGSPLSSATGG